MLKNCWARTVLKLTGAIALIALGGCSTPREKNATEPVFHGETRVVKSPSDDRDYRYLTLESGLKVLLVSDPDTDQSAAAVDVNVGRFNDPDNRLGLAHFLEHMLFLGSNKYPEVGGYDKYIQANGGSSNAFTSDRQTNYFFEINSGHLREALDRLAQFFVAPTLDRNYVDRERHAVDSEYRMHAREDLWRLYTAQNAASGAGHPKSRFYIGSLDTLNNDDGQSLWQDLKTFYDQFYVAENMRVVVYGKESTDTLERWVKESFAGVPTHPSKLTRIGKAPYTKEDVGVRVNLVPLKNTRLLSLNFPLEDTHSYYKKKPLGYLSRIIGYEGEGSLYSLLKNRGLIISLGAYPIELPGEYAEFAISMELTAQGLDQVDYITEVVFGYLELIRKKGITERLYNENKAIAELDFRFQEEDSPQSVVSDLASLMQYLPAEDLLQVNHLFEAFDPQLIRRLLDKMIPDNLRMIVTARGLKTDKIEPYFEAHYSVEALPKSMLQKWREAKPQSGLMIPAPNPFIPDDLVLKESVAGRYPEHIIEKPGLDVWSLTDTEFSVPKALVRLEISTPLASDTPENLLRLQLYRTLLERSLNEYGYPAQEAGLYFALLTNREGLEIFLSGYHDKLPDLLKTILKSIEQFAPKKETFEQEKVRLIRAIENKAFKKPFRKGSEALEQVIYPHNPDDETLLQAVKSVTYDSLLAYSQSLYDAVHITMLVHGNFTQQHAHQLGEMVESMLLTGDNASVKYTEPYRLLSDQQRLLELEFKHDDSLFIYYFQRPETDNRSRAQYALLGRMLASPFYKSIRTDQQLGYVIFASPKVVEKHPGIIFLAQSPKKDPVELEKRVRVFLRSQAQRMTDLTEKTLDEYRQGLIGELVQKDSNLDSRGARFWSSLQTDEPFDNRHKIAKALETIKVVDIQKAFNHLLEGQGSLIIRSFGENHKEAKADGVAEGVCVDIQCLDDLPRNE